MLRVIFEGHGVAFPMTKLISFVDTRGTLMNGSSVGNARFSVGSTPWQVSFLLPTGKMLPQFKKLLVFCVDP